MWSAATRVAALHCGSVELPRAGGGLRHRDEERQLALPHSRRYAQLRAAGRRTNRRAAFSLTEARTVFAASAPDCAPPFM